MQQLSVFLENKAGMLEKALACIAGEGIDIRALSLPDTSDFGILRLIVTARKKAEEVLRKEGFTVGSTCVHVLEMNDAPGELLGIVRLLAERGINIEYMYPFAGKGKTAPGMVFRFERMDLAREILEENNISLVKEADLAE